MKLFQGKNPQSLSVFKAELVQHTCTINLAAERELEMQLSRIGSLFTLPFANRGYTSML